MGGGEGIERVICGVCLGCIRAVGYWRATKFYKGFARVSKG